MPHAAARFFSWLNRPAERRRRFAAQALLLVATIIAAGETISLVGRHWRLAIDVQKVPCMPARVSLVKMGHPGDVTRGDLVAYRTNRAGKYFSQEQMMGKRIAGIAGDTIVVRDLGLWINGQRVRDLELCRRKYLAEYCADRNETVPTGHVFLLADHPESFDSRYWGAIPAGQLVGRIVWPSFPTRE